MCGGGTGAKRRSEAPHRSKQGHSEAKAFFPLASVVGFSFCEHPASLQWLAELSHKQ